MQPTLPEEVTMRYRTPWFEPIDPELSTADVMAELDPALLDWDPAAEPVS